MEDIITVFMFTAVVLCCSHDLFNYDDLLKNDNVTNLNHAFDVAYEKFGIERLLEAEGEGLFVVSVETFISLPCSQRCSRL